MVSDFISEYDGYLRLTDDEYEQAHSSHSGLWKEARYLLKYGSAQEGYWNSEKFLRQVKRSSIHIQAIALCFYLTKVVGTQGLLMMLIE